MIWTVLGALGGIVAFLGAVAVVVRAIARQIRTTDRNTQAVNDLTREITALKTVFNGHETRISRLEGWRERAPGPRRG